MKQRDTWKISRVIRCTDRNRVPHANGPAIRSVERRASHCSARTPERGALSTGSTFRGSQRESVEARYAGTIAMGEPAAFFPPREEGTHTDTRGTIRARVDHRTRARAHNLSFHRTTFGSRSSTTVINVQVKSAETGRYAVVNAAGLRP